MIPPIKTATVMLPGDSGSFEVAGLTLPDILVVLARRGPELGEAFDHIKAAQTEAGVMSQATAESLAMKMATAFPNVVAEIIAVANGDCTDEAVVRVKALPIGPQVDAILKIAALSFSEEFPAKKAIEAVRAYLAEALGLNASAI